MHLWAVHCLQPPPCAGSLCSSGFDLPTSGAPMTRAQLGIADDAFLILCIARFAAYKRHDVLIEAVARASRECPQIRLLLIGEPSSPDPSYGACIEALGRTGLRAKTALLGFQADVLPFEATADAVVLCSQREPLGTVVLESMALGRPIVVAASGGLRGVGAGRSGLHCIPGDPDSLCRQLVRLAKDPELATGLGKVARQQAVERFSLPAHANTLLSIYAEVIGGSVRNAAK
jgi:glycosyltransferase involved in cell wall biosynthesis